MSRDVLGRKQTGGARLYLSRSYQEFLTLSEIAQTVAGFTNSRRGGGGYGAFSHTAGNPPSQTARPEESGRERERERERWAEESSGISNTEQNKHKTETKREIKKPAGRGRDGRRGSLPRPPSKYLFYSVHAALAFGRWRRRRRRETLEKEICY
ncbi:hypothetical protein LY76DRAFT_136102 [Colletotrichum caudatum]|nr:hypothetical protein LY76DRAFT_136102 [Colletotrichum caudatum]